VTFRQLVYKIACGRKLFVFLPFLLLVWILFGRPAALSFTPETTPALSEADASAEAETPLALPLAAGDLVSTLLSSTPPTDESSQGELSFDAADPMATSTAEASALTAKTGETLPEASADAPQEVAPPATKDALVPPGEREGDVIVSEHRHQNLSAVLVKRASQFLPAPQYELWLSSTPALPEAESAPASVSEAEAATPAKTEPVEALPEEAAPLAAVVAGEEALVAAKPVSELVNGGETAAPPESEPLAIAADESANENNTAALPLAENTEIAQTEPSPYPSPATTTAPVPADAEQKPPAPPPPKKEWVFVTDHLLSPNTRALLADGNLFWFELGGHAVWRFNIGTSAFESVSVNAGETPRLYFRDEASQWRVFEKDAWGFTQILDVETIEEGVQ
jgi:hypothetical protein